MKKVLKSIIAIVLLLTSFVGVSAPLYSRKRSRFAGGSMSSRISR